MNEAEFFTGVLAGLGMTATPWRLAVFAEWHRREGMPLEETWNPIATTRYSANTPLNESYDIGYGRGNWNSVPVRVYANAQAGITATVETLSLSYYTNIIRSLRDQKGYPEAVNDFATYVGSVAYGQSLVDFMNSCTASKAGDAQPAPTVDLLALVVSALTGLSGQAAIARLQKWSANGNSLLDGFILDQGRINKLEAQATGVPVEQVEQAVKDALIKAASSL